jgi:hypothetical protein
LATKTKQPMAKVERLHYGRVAFKFARHLIKTKIYLFSISSSKVRYCRMKTKVDRNWY